MEYPPYVGGIAVYVHNLASALEKDSVVLLAPVQKDSEEWDAQAGYKVIRKKMLFPKLIWPRWIRLYFQVRKIVKQEEIELIMIHHVLPVGYIGILIQKLRKIPFLLFSHGTDLAVGTKNGWKKKMVTWISKNSEQIIFNSHSLQDRYLKVLPQFENKSFVLYPCPEPDLLVSPPKEEIDILRAKYALEGKQVILSVSRLTDGKGFPHLVRIMPEILKQAPHLVWMIIGDGPKKEKLVSEIQANNLQNVTRFLGEIPHAELKKYYYLADLFVLLTHPDEGREEGLGLVFLEAAATGLPSVAGKSGGVEEAVLNGETGMVLNVHTETSLIVDAIVKLVVDKEYANKLGSQAQARIKADFNWEGQVRLLDKWIR